MGIMTAVKILHIEKGKLGIWKFREPSEELQRIFRFTEKEKAEFQSIKYENRKREYLAVRLLLEQLLGEKAEISYTSRGKPRLENNPLSISISHSSDLAVVLLSEKNAGVDAENIRRDAEKVAHRFLSENELNAVKNSHRAQLQCMLYWCAKEAAFKFSVLPEIEFKSHINISNFAVNTDGGVFTGKLSKEQPNTNLAFHYLFYENNVVVYCVEKE